MHEDSEKVQFVKDTLGTRQAYHKIIAKHDFTDSEKDGSWVLESLTFEK